VNRLRRAAAPISERAWEAIDDEAQRTLRHFLAARRVVDFEGPRGWDHATETLGGVDELPPLRDAVTTRLRRVLPLMELRTEFEISREVLDAIDSGLRDPDLSTVRDAAREVALAEDEAVFNGYKAAGIAGIKSDTPHQPLEITESYQEYPRSVAQAVGRLHDEGIAGPYAIALGPRCYTGVIETTERGGFPVLEHIRMIVGGPIVSALAVDGAVVLSRRGGDFTLTSGGDFAIGYVTHDDRSVRLFLEESMTFRNSGPEAAVALVYPG
jgi:uncharacterized linocin/CFP29 family protein